MRLLAALGFATAVASAVHGAVDNGCKRLTDRDSLLVQSLAVQYNVTEAQLNEVPFETIFEPIDRMFPWLSTCLASIDPLITASNVVADQKTAQCLQDVGDVEAPYLLGNRYFSKYLCPLYNDTIVPCMNDVVIKHAVSAMASTEGCCDAMNDKIMETFGYNLQDMMDYGMKLVGNSVCSSKTFTDPNRTMANTLTCGYTLTMALFAPDYVSSISNLFQVPNDQACDAMTGNPFQTTNGLTYQFFKEGQVPIGACFEPIDELLSHIRQYPFMAKMQQMDPDSPTTQINLTQLFDDNQCLKGDELLQFIGADESLVMKVLQIVDNTQAAVSDLITSAGYAGVSSSYYGEPSHPMNLTDQVRRHMIVPAAQYFAQLCFHLPNGVTEQCDYGTDTLTKAYALNIPPPTLPAADSDDKTNTNTTTNVNVKSQAPTHSISATAFMIATSVVALAWQPF